MADNILAVTEVNGVAICNEFVTEAQALVNSELESLTFLTLPAQTSYSELDYAWAYSFMHHLEKCDTYKVLLIDSNMAGSPTYGLATGVGLSTMFAYGSMVVISNDTMNTYIRTIQKIDPTNTVNTVFNIYTDDAAVPASTTGVINCTLSNALANIVSFEANYVTQINFQSDIDPTLDMVYIVLGYCFVRSYDVNYTPSVNNIFIKLITKS